MLPSKLSSVKNSYDPCDLEDKVKVKLVLLYKRFAHYASLTKISSLYLNCLLNYGHLSVPLVITEKFNFDPKNPEMSDFILGIP